MADINTQNEFSYLGKTPLLRGLKNPSGQFFLFSQYAEDLTKFLGNPTDGMPIPTSFYCFNVVKPDTEVHANETVTDEDPDEPVTVAEPTELSLTSSNSNANDTRWTPEQIAALFIDPADEDELFPGQEQRYIDLFNSLYCKELMYKGHVNIFGRDKVDGIDYNEIYCHIDNDAKRQKINLNLSDYIDYKYGKNYVIGYGPNPNPYQFTNYSDLIGEIFQNEYENGNTFFKLNNDAFDDKWEPKYSLGRLLYVLYKNKMIHFTIANEEINQDVVHLWDDEPDITDYTNNGEITSSNTVFNTTNLSNSSDIEYKAGVLSSKALFDSWHEGDGTAEDPARGEYRFFKTNEMIVNDMPEKVKFDFNCIIVCYSHRNSDGTVDNEEIPMGIYFTGYDISKNDFSNGFTKYVKNMEIYNQGTSYTLRICGRTIASQATEQGAERIFEILSASNTGEWVNEYEQLMCKFDETNNTLEKARSIYAQMNDNIETSLQLFRNNRTNVPYIATVNGIKYWFVNGTNMWVKAIEAGDFADWDRSDDRIVPEFTQVEMRALPSDNCTILPEGTSIEYVGGIKSYTIVPDENYEIVKIRMAIDMTNKEYILIGTGAIDFDNNAYNDPLYSITIIREDIGDDIYQYVFTFNNIIASSSISADTENINS